MTPVQSIAYIAPSMILAFLTSPMGILQGIYAKHFGMSLAAIATVLLVSRLFDAVSDPLIGYWSDRYHSKSGSRKPFVIVGGLLFIVSSYFLYVPVDPDHLNAETVVSTTYFMGWFLVFYLAWALVEIPHLAWGAELATSTQEKNKIYSLRAFSTYAGILLFYLVPFLPIFSGNAFTPQTLQWTAVAAGLLMLPVLYCCVKLTPDGARISRQRGKQTNLWALRNEILSNKPFLIFTAAFALYGMGAAGMIFTLLFIFIDTYLGLSEHFALLSLIGICSCLLSLGFWYWVANRLEKKVTWILGVLFYVVGVLGISLLEPGVTGIAGLVVIITLLYIASAAITALSPSLLADIIDYSTWKFGTDRTATYFSVYTFASKTSMAIGGSIGFGLAGWYGFDPSTAVHTEKAIFGLRLAACWLPTVIILLSALTMAWVPMNAHRHRTIQRRLAARLAQRSTMSQQPIADSTATALKTAPS